MKVCNSNNLEPSDVFRSPSTISGGAVLWKYLMANRR